MTPLEFDCAGERLQALPDGALLWPARRLLAVADLHLEKGSSYA
ncbi:MAG: phosphoesterase, partial [Alphaproteobacteria bacterium]|nr:phosphoesterase [Alphaproteobacteria bacterium]